MHDKSVKPRSSIRKKMTLGFRSAAATGNAEVQAIARATVDRVERSERIAKIPRAVIGGDDGRRRHHGAAARAEQASLGRVKSCRRSSFQTNARQPRP